MKIQACKFTRTKASLQERGLVFQDYFDSYDVLFIVDEWGKKVKRIYDYKLIIPTLENPHVAIDLDSIALVQKGKNGIKVVLDTETNSI